MTEERIAGIAYQIRVAEREYLNAIDGACRRCVLLYPFWLSHFWRMIRFFPPQPAQSREVGERVMVRREGGGSRRRSRRDSVLAEDGRRRFSEHETDVRYLDM